MKLLLIQSRPPQDAMIAQELTGIRRRLGDRPVQVSARNAVAEPARIEWLHGVDAVIFGGSGAYSVHHPRSQPWVTPMRAVIEDLLMRNVPCFGICFGHQLIGLHLGAPVITDPDREEVGTVQLRLTWEGRQDPLFGQLDEVFSAHTGHSDHVVGLPPGIALLATGQGCTTQAFKVIDRPVYTTQFHPELTGAEARARYMTNKRDDLGMMPSGLGAMASRFQPGADATAMLLGAFVDGLLDR